MQATTVRFQPYWITQKLKLDTNIITNNTSVLEISKFRCYISNIAFKKNNVVVWQEPNSYHLIDANDTSSYSIKLNMPATLIFDQIHFNIGIDSTTNVSGAMGGDLDPTKGMYWAWNSGYINFKLEGSSPLCTTHNKRFQYHIGGFSIPFNTLQQVDLPVHHTTNINIAIQLDQMVAQIDLEHQNSIMQPGRAAVEFSKKIAGIFRIKL